MDFSVCSLNACDFCIAKGGNRVSYSYSIKCLILIDLFCFQSNILDPISLFCDNLIRYKKRGIIIHRVKTYNVNLLYRGLCFPSGANSKII